jgi:4-hydroxy-3-methylbut-2-enyl diphosphate reductase IspH
MNTHIDHMNGFLHMHTTTPEQVLNAAELEKNQSFSTLHFLRQFHIDFTTETTCTFAKTNRSIQILKNDYNKEQVNSKMLCNSIMTRRSILLDYG